jgi:hypothetical protein
MARLESSREYVGAVDHPETGELIQLDESHPSDVAEVVAAEYDYLHVESEASDSDTDESAPDAADDAEAETLRCGVNGCSRKVDSADATCWQH